MTTEKIDLIFIATSVFSVFLDFLVGNYFSFFYWSNDLSFSLNSVPTLTKSILSEVWSTTYHHPQSIFGLKKSYGTGEYEVRTNNEIKELWEKKP